MLFRGNDEELVGRLNFFTRSVAGMTKSSRWFGFFTHSFARVTKNSEGFLFLHTPKGGNNVKTMIERFGSVGRRAAV